MAGWNSRNQWLKEHPAAQLYHSAHYRCNASGLEFTITQEDVIIPEKCPCCGVVLTKGKGRPPAKSAWSLDRLDNDKGYVKGNVWVICWRCNVIKRDATVAELRAIADAMEAQLAIK